MSPIHRPHNGWGNKFISGYNVYKTVSQSVQESVCATTEQSINSIEIAPRDFYQHPSHSESNDRLNIRAHCGNTLGHFWSCTKTITLEISCHAFLLPHTCVKQFYFCYFQLVEEEQSKSAYTQRLHDTGAGWWSWTNSGCARSKHSCVLHYFISGSPGNYRAGDRVQLQVYFSQLSTAAEDVLFSFPMQRDEHFL